MRSAIAISLLLAAGSHGFAQCTNYTITVGGGIFDFEIDWELVDDQGIVVASGFAPTVTNVCLPDGCYTMLMYDTFGDGWNGASYAIRVLPANTLVASGTLSAGGFGSSQVDLGGGCSGSGNCDLYTLTVTSGIFPTEISWNLIGGATIVATGFAPSAQVLCLDTGCYVMQLFDSFGDGWNGATWTITSSGGTVMGTGTLAAGSIGQASVDLGSTVPCSGGGGPVTASDCPDAVNVCTDYSFQIDPNGEGALYEIPPLGSLGNPDFIPGDAILSPWGSDNWGCLRNDELNSTWMVVNIWGGGSLEFTFGGLGTQAGFYDWIMYPYGPNACSSILNNQVAPIRCNWNGVAFGGTGLAATPPPGGDASNFEPPLNVLAGEQYLICFSNWSSVTTLVPLEFGGTAIVSCDEVVLPLELISFDAVVEQQSIRLRWRTASEQDVARFRILRSSDAEHWEELGTQEAVGNSHGMLDYSYLDMDPLFGRQYYQLLMEDLDGIGELSEMRWVHWRVIGAMVHPNPATDELWVRTRGGAIQVHDQTGRTVPVTVKQSLEEMILLAFDLIPGVYFVTIEQGDDLTWQRFLVR
ncbi:MAG: T9SS type A sorting domain-containing protein [Flavobacteriales bacterium]|nr:T9SS type A sorting domain-containing protein [Flavobacteriales bacterium]